MVLIYFVYGLAFFSLGLAIALELRQSSGLKLAASLPYLAAFGLLHSLVEWADMLLLLEPSAIPSASIETVRIFRILLLGLSTLALLQFGASLLPNRWLRRLPPILALVWMATLLSLSASYPIGGRQWLVHGDIWARNLLYLPGSLLAGIGLFRQSRLLGKSDYRQVGRDAQWAAVMFLLNAVAAGVVVPSGAQWLASPINHDSFLALFGFPVQLLRAAFAMGITFFMLRLLRIFPLESARMVEVANRERLQAPLEERERLAREMHDGLAQIIGLLGMKARLVGQALNSGDQQRARTDLDQMQQLLKDAYADVRQYILSLRTSTDLEGGLAAAIKESALDFREESPIPLELSLSADANLSISQEAGVQLVRIVQEALANVRKHSRATRAAITLERRDGEAILVVEDDGIGFDPSELEDKRRHCFGLKTMAERAASIGARWELVPVEKGTRIRVRYRLERSAESAVAS